MQWGAPFIQFAGGFASSWLSMISLMAALIVVELVWNRGLMPLEVRLRAILFQTTYIAFRVAFFIGFYSALRSFGLPRLLEIRGWGGLVIALVVYDFCYYWMHRAEHRIPGLWRYHKVHHSIEHMGAGTGFQHVTSIAIEAVCLTLPLALFAAPLEASWVMFLVGVHGAYLHTTSRLNLGPLGWLIGDNRTHRIHHSVEPRHFDKNFGVPLLLWDRVFGTAYLPKRDEWPAVGLADLGEPQSVAAFLAPHRRLHRTSDNARVI